MLIGAGIYGASKAALTLLSETLRLEMTPFDVKVVAIITGGVQTNIMANGPEPVLPSSSRYTFAEKNIYARAAGEDVGSKTTSEDYAERVVSDVLDGANGKIWRGKLASTVRYLSAFPVSLYVRHFSMRCQYKISANIYQESAIMRGSGLDTFSKTA